MSINLRVERTTPQTVAVGANVLFNNVPLQDGAITYDPATGVITINRAGTFVINWAVSAKATLSTSGTVFSLITSSGGNITNNNCRKTGEASGFGIINVTTPGETVRLINTSLDSIVLQPIVPIKASLILFEEVQWNGLVAYGGLYNDEVNPEIALVANVAQQVTFNNVMASSNVILGTNEITIIEDGDYEINYELLIHATATALILLVMVRSNGNVIPSTLINRVIGVGMQFPISGSVIASLSAGDVIDLAVEASVTQTLTSDTNTTLSVKKLDA